MSFFRSRRYLRSRREPTKVPAKCRFPISEELVSRQLEAAKGKPVNGIKRIWRTDHPEPVKPRIDIPEHFPIG